MRIGVAGFGRMGALMAARFVAEGHDLAVWNRSPQPAASAAALGARVVSTPRELAQSSEIVLTSLFDEQAVRAVYFGEEGLLSVGLQGRLLIDTSTMPPALGSELALAARTADGRFVDAPVLGSVVAARQGTLIALAGGAPDDVKAAGPVLAMISKALHVLGPSGAGYAGKLAINLLKATYWATLGDCLALAGQYGIETSRILDIVETGPGALVDFALKLPVLRGEPTEPAFDIAGCLKDLCVIVAAGGGPDQVPVAAGALHAVERAVAGGWAHRDVAAIALFAASQIPKPDLLKAAAE